MSHDPTLTPNQHFPKLTPHNHRITSPADPNYNCVAWAASDSTQWWEPGWFWPIDGADLKSIMEASGYCVCSKSDAQQSDVAIVLYRDEGEYTHIAWRLPSGKWTSKFGKWQDIEHDHPEDVAEGIYGEISDYLHQSNHPS